MGNWWVHGISMARYEVSKTQWWECDQDTLDHLLTI
jgi:hypothetical protein